MPESYEERIDLPNGQSLWYIDEHPTDPGQNHSYWRHNPKTGRKGRRLAGVTTVTEFLQTKREKRQLQKWAAKTQCIGIAELYVSKAIHEGADSLDWLSNERSIWQELEAYGLTFDDVRERHARRGTNVHEVGFQALGMGRPVPDKDRLTKEEFGHVVSIEAFWLDHEPVARLVEQIVFSDRLGIAGRLDFLGMLGAKCGRPGCACAVIDFDRESVIDAKTGRFVSASAHVQVGGGYPLLTVESGLLPACSPATLAAVEAEEREQCYRAAAGRLNRLLLQTREDGTYNLIAAEGTPEQFEIAVAADRATKDIINAAKKARERRETERAMQDQIDAAVEAVA